MGVVAEVAQRVVAVCRQVVEEAPVRELFGNPRHPHAGLIRSIPRLDLAATEHHRLETGLGAGLLHPPAGCPSPRCRYCHRCLPAAEPPLRG